MAAAELYDSIGASYTVTRRTDPRIAARIWAALGDAETVLNVGAGTGSYEPSDRHVLALEPSAQMRSQRPGGAAPCVPGSPENLPFDDQSFGALRSVQVLASLPELAAAIDARTEPVPIPWDCADGFFEAYWRRPEAYLDEDVRRGVSVWDAVGPDAERRVVKGLGEDLRSGRWAERNSEVLDLDAAELGARLLIA
jgi:hypothetical protein